MARPFSRPQYRSLSPNSDTYRSANALVASGYRVRKQDADQMRRLALPWQKRAFAYYDLVPEIKYASQFYAKALSVLRLYAGVRMDDGTIEETDNTDVIAHLDRMQDPGGGGREGLLSAYGQLRFLTGECYLVVTVDPDTDREQWECLSTDELRPEGSGYIRLRAPGLNPQTLREPTGDDQWEPIDENTAVVYRLFKRHPRYSEMADSTMQGVLDICEELVLLTQAVRSRARSRLAGSGLLLLNSRFVPAPPAPKAGEETVDPFMRDFMQAMTSPIVNEGAASAVVPHVVRVDVPANEQLDNVMKHIQIIDPMQTYPETGLRYELIKRLSIGLDMPPEILVGLADSNHWNAWQVDEQTWKSHLQPVANAMVNDFTTAWFQPTLRAEGISDWDRYVVFYDASAVINHPDRSKDAKDLYNQRAIGKAALRDANGFTDDDAPSDEELLEMIGIAVRDGSLALYGIPSVKAGGIEPEAGEIVTPSGDEGTPTGTPPGPEKAADVTKEPPTDGNGDGGTVASAAQDRVRSTIAHLEREALVARALGAADVAFFRARELAGARLKSYAKRNPDARKAIDGIANHRVAAALGTDTARAIGAPPARQLVDGAAEILAETLAQWGVAAEVVEWLGDRLEQYAAATLFEERPGPLPQTFAVYIRSVADRREEVPA